MPLQSDSQLIDLIISVKVQTQYQLDFDLELNSEDEKQLINNCNNFGNSAANKKRNRRKSKDIPKDKVMCGCGNHYSCSSALSIHIKNKHGGVPPNGTIGHTQPGKRRRQSKNRQLSQMSHNESSSYEETKQQNNNMIILSLKNDKTKGGIAKNINNTDSQSIISNKNQSNISNAKEMDFNDSFFRINSGGKHDSRSDYNDMDSEYQDNATVSSQFGGIDTKLRKFRGVNGRQYVSKRIYMCGCLEAFGFVEQLAIHVDKSHQGKIPDGSIYGIKKQALMKFFYIPYARPQANPNRRIYLFKCGCGRQYSCSSSLYYHIKTVHQGSQPIGTIVGVPKSRQ